MAQVIDGKAIAEGIRGEVKAGVERLKGEGVTPGLAAILVGEDMASKVYVRNKQKACHEVGMRSEVFALPGGTSEAALLKKVRELNDDEGFHGILVQQPLPRHISEGKVVEAVDPGKDVDCFHPYNLGRLFAGNPTFKPATPSGVVELLLRSGNDPAGKDVVILGRSSIVGKPLAALLMGKGRGGNATVTVCHTATADIVAHARRADILVAAAGKAQFVGPSMVKEGAVVIDVGINRVPDPKAERGYRMVGDVDFEAVFPKARAITPVPGGVGPMTIAMLLRNTLEAARGKEAF
jgi:methylenetetrahydrofolate dehydrogenase (NADP+)/methenyltetrahydrofolate cyclohydrolase